MYDRLSEHLRFANNPIAPSYNEKAMAVHYYRQKHLGETANLKFEKPIINDKSEIKILHRFLVQGDVIVSYSLGNSY